MATRRLIARPIQANWSEAANTGLWFVNGDASYIPTGDNNGNTGLLHTNLFAPGGPPAFFVRVDFNNANSTPGQGWPWSLPVLNPGEVVTRVRGVMVADTGDYWSAVIRVDNTDLTAFSAGYQSEVIYWMHWASQWCNVPNLDQGGLYRLSASFGPNFGFNSNGTFIVKEFYFELETYAPDPVVTPPTASFTMSTSARTVSVDGNASTGGSGYVTGHAWNWGDGSAVTTGATAVHSYTADGTYTVTLTVSSSSGLTNVMSRPASVQAVPGNGGQPEIPDPDPVPPPASTPPPPPILDTSVIWSPIAKSWATEFDEWFVVDKHLNQTQSVDVPPTTLIDYNKTSGIAPDGTASTLTLHMPRGDEFQGTVGRATLPSGQVFKRMKVRVDARLKQYQQTVDFSVRIKDQSGATISDEVQTFGGWWESPWVPLAESVTDADLDGYTVVVTADAETFIIHQLYVTTEYGLPGATLPPLPTDSEDALRPLYGSLTLSVTPGAAGIPNLASPATLSADAAEVVPMVGNVDNGITWPAGYGIGGYGLNVGVIDGYGVEWWLTDIEGWNSGFTADMSVIEPQLGTGTFLNNVAERGREVTVRGTLYSKDVQALRSARRRLQGCLSEKPHIGWMRHNDTLLPVALAEPIRVDHVGEEQVDFEAVFKGVRAPYSLGMGVWREGKQYDRLVGANGYIDYPVSGTTPMTPIVTITGPLVAGSRIDSYSLGGTYRSGGLVLTKDLPEGVTLNANCILRTVKLPDGRPGSEYLDWASSRWMAIDPRGGRVIAIGQGSGNWFIQSRELW